MEMNCVTSSQGVGVWCLYGVSSLLTVVFDTKVSSGVEKFSTIPVVYLLVSVSTFHMLNSVHYHVVCYDVSSSESL